MNKKMVIYKYTIAPETHINLPVDAKVLSVQMQHGSPRMWILYDDNAPKIERSFILLPTGDIASAIELKEFIGTFQMHNGDYVWHLFEIDLKTTEA